MSFDKQEIIKYRIERAKETLIDAKILAKEERWNAVANRLYYSCFYAVLALCLKNNFITKTHSGVKTFFNNEFIKTKILPTSDGKFYNIIFNKRQEGDYNDIKKFKKEEIEPLILETEDFIKSIYELVNFEE